MSFLGLNRIRGSLGLQIAAGLSISFALLVIVGLCGVVQLRTMQAQTEAIQEAASLDATARDILTQLLNEETAIRAYSVTGYGVNLRRYDEARAALPRDLSAITTSAKRYPQLGVLIDAARPTIDKITTFFDDEVRLVSSGKRSAAVAELTAGGIAVEEYRAVAAQIVAQTQLILNGERAQMGRGTAKHRGP